MAPSRPKPDPEDLPEARLLRAFGFFSGRGPGSLHDVLEDMKTALDAGADPNGPRTSTGQSFLAMAARHGEPFACSMLLAAGADPNDLDLAGRSALDWALSHDRERAVFVLLRDGVDPFAGKAVERAATQLAARPRTDRIDVFEAVFLSACDRAGDGGRVGRLAEALEAARPGFKDRQVPSRILSAYEEALLRVCSSEAAPSRNFTL